MFEIIRPDTKIDFISKWKFCVFLSLGLILLSVVFVKINGIRFGVDFQGGTEVQYRFAENVKVEDEKLRSIVSGLGFEDVAVVRYGAAEDNEFLVHFKEDPGEHGERLQALREQIVTQIGELETGKELRAEFVGPKVGEELRRDGLLSLVYSCLLMLLYIAFRFNPRFAPGAIVALTHDVLIVAGVFVILGRPFDLQTLAALLAIMGYSINDTIIVFDRIRENMALRTKVDLVSVVNESVNQTLSRTALTSGTTLLAVLALLILGGEVIRPFALAMTIGIVVGTYSSIYIAAPIYVFLEQRRDAKAAAKMQAARPR